MKTAIQSTNIKQASYSDDSPNAKQKYGYNAQSYNAISRHVFLPSISEIGKIVDLKSSDKIKAFLNGVSIWTRDSYQRLAYHVESLSVDYGCLLHYNVNTAYGVRPAFVIDLSQVSYSVVK